MAYENGNGHSNGNGSTRGRRSKWTTERAESIVADLGQGLTRKAAAIRAGISESTLGDWLRQRPHFRAACEKAELSAYSEDKAKLIESALKAGNSRPTACTFANIGPATFTTWCEQQPGFAARIEAAEAYAEIGHVANVFQAANKGAWQASAWWLERRHPDRWGRTDKVALEIRTVAARIAEQTGADPDWLLRRAEEIALAQMTASSEP